jgi:hypothetical protein
MMIFSPNGNAPVRIVLEELKLMNRSTLAVLLTLAGGYAHAEFNPIPKESGFSGYAMVGGNYSDVHSNTLIGPKKSESNYLSSLDSQASSDGTSPLLNLDLRYTLADSRTQFYLGSLIQDMVTLDFTQQLGVRTEMADKGIGSIGYVFSGIPGQVWQDPYLTGAERQKSDRNSNGIRVGWDSIWGSNWGANYTYRDISIDDERSGSSLMTLTSAERGQLDRNGKLHLVEVSYNWFGPRGSILSPSLNYAKNQADGDAVSYQRIGGQLSYALMQPQYSLVTNALLNQLQYDKANPVFGRKVDATQWGLNANFFWHKLAGIEKLSAVFSASYGESDANVHFFDSDLTSVGAGLMYKI